ncbi:bifunctional metallophosphatase/5'-nucleotidase [Haloparvum sp. PAK95]|uniref:bifunctional metallophosphatase/5'-nucleotidase n=1 Tax=Haloparvum sp. PAK95 TaxID=3418962 RepID=UPI003D2F08F2
MPRLLHYSDIENVFDTPERAARLAGRIAALDGADAAVVGSGDTTAPGVLSLVAQGRQTLDFYASTETILDTFGNHEFDYGADALRELVAEATPTFVSANVRDEDGEPFGREQGVVPHETAQVDGATVGFVGLTDPATDSLNPMAGPLTFTDPIAAARDAITELREEHGVDYVVVLSHLGAGDDDLARAVDADAILGGHVHSRRNEYVDDTLVVRPGVNGQAIAEIELDGRPTATLHERDGAEPHEELKTALEQRMAAADLDEGVAEVDEPIERTGDVVHGGECRAGNFVADAFRWAHEDEADVGLSNAGGLRSGDPFEGTVTKADLISLIPFEEPVVLVEVTGEELRAVFREMAAPDVDFGKEDWWHGHVSNARVVWDEDAEELVEATVDGEPIDPEATYTIATSEYLLHSDHEFPTLEEHHRIGEDGIQHEVLYDYALEHGIDPEIEGRIRIVGDAVETAVSE